MAKPLQRKTGVALWRQIADAIRHDIVAGLNDGTARLPGEMALAERFSVNRHTVRTALKALADEGVVETRHGDGTYVLRPERILFPVGRRTRFSDGIGDQASNKTLEVLSASTERPGKQAAQALDLSAGEAALRLELVSFADDTALARATAWFAADRFDGLADAVREAQSITQGLKHVGVTEYHRAWTEVQARHATDDEMRSLKLAPGAIVLVATSLNHDAQGRPLQFGVTRFSADRVTLRLDTGALA